MNNKAKVTIAIALGVACAGSALAFNNVQRQHSLESMPNDGDAIKGSRRPATPQELALMAKGEVDLANIRRLKNQPEAVSKLLPYLHHPVKELRAEAVRMLGQLGSPAAEEPLVQMVAELDKAIAAKTPVTSSMPPAVPLRMALARIRTRELKGEERFKAVAAEMGVTQNELATLSQQVNGPEYSWMQDTYNATLVQEFVDLLYDMAQQGEQIDTLVQPLTFTPAQKVMLQAAPLPLEQKFDFLLKSLNDPKVFFTQNGELIDSIVNDGPAGVDLLMQRLQDMQTNPEQYKRTALLVYQLLFRVAARTGDPRALPLLKEFEVNPKILASIREEARQAREQLEHRQS